MMRYISDRVDLWFSLVPIFGAVTSMFFQRFYCESTRDFVQFHLRIISRFKYETAFSTTGVGAPECHQTGERHHFIARGPLTSNGFCLSMVCDDCNAALDIL